MGCDRADTRKHEERPWYVYLLECADGTFYVGVTLDVARRVQQHDKSRGARYTAGRGPVNLLGVIPCATQGEALRLERRLKKRRGQDRRRAFAAAAALPGSQSAPAAGAPLDYSSGRLTEAMLTFSLQGSPEPQQLAFSPRKLLLGGFTGRDQAAVRQHVEELEAIGVPAPPHTPTFYPITLDRLTTAAAIEVLGEKTSGEAEFVLLFQGGDIYVAAGSDQTDRDLERDSIGRAKQLCPKIISPAVWRYADLRDRWDELVLRSWVGQEGRETLHQESKVAVLLPPQRLIEYARERVGGDGDLEGLVLYSGTFSSLSGQFVYSRYFEVELADEKTGRALRCAYRVQPLDWFVDR